jgi:polyhydroxyalkanoate synthesis regulator phasin
MPQPKKSGSSARKPAARQPAARTPASSKPARKGPAAKPPPHVQRPAARAGRPGGAQTDEARQREDQLLAAIASLRDLLAKGIVITAEVLQETIDEAVTRGRMTRQDAEDLAQNLISIGRRQSQDVLAEIEHLVGRSAKETSRQARARVKSVGAAARRAPGTDRALRTVDRVRRAAGLGHAFPIIGYDDLTTGQVKQRLAELGPAELRKVRDHERRNANRKSVLMAIDRRLQ